jgi:hypothetical protein
MFVTCKFWTNIPRGYSVLDMPLSKGRLLALTVNVSLGIKALPGAWTLKHYSLEI